MSNSKKYLILIKEIKELIYQSQYTAMKHVNIELIKLYWEIGEMIFHKQQEQGWGKSVIEDLAKELQKEFPGVKGFTARNLWFMRSFYIEYTEKPLINSTKEDNRVSYQIDNQEDKTLKPLVSELEDDNNLPDINSLQQYDNQEDKILKPLVSEFKKIEIPKLLTEISWAKNIVIIQKCKDNLMREFYIRMTKMYGWTKDVLINNIENRVYEKYLTNQTNFDKTVKEKYRLQAKLAVKDSYNFDFLEMGEQHSEAELERSIIKNIRAFLVEMGGDFCFIGNQFRIEVGDDDYYIDLLLYHRRLKCLVAIELKIGEFEPEYTGKMQFYLEALNRKMKMPDENVAIGVIICKYKDRTKVEFALSASNEPIGVATYSFHDKLPEELHALMPSPSDIINLIDSIENIEL